MEKDIDFAKAFEESWREVKSGEIIKGTVAGISNGNIIIDLGFKSDGIMPFSEYSDEATADPEKELKVGQEIEAFVVRVNLEIIIHNASSLEKEMLYFQEEKSKVWKCGKKLIHGLKAKKLLQLKL